VIWHTLAPAFRGSLAAPDQYVTHPFR
jgi:hypothetical protein